MAAVQLRDATREIARRNRVLAKAIARLAPLRHSARDPDGPFGALVRAIVYQQLADPAAQAIYTRVRATVGPALTPESSPPRRMRNFARRACRQTSSRRCATWPRK